MTIDRSTSFRRTLTDYEMNGVRNFSEWKHRGVPNFEEEDPDLFVISDSIVDNQFRALTLSGVNAMNRMISSYRFGDREAALILQTLFDWHKLRSVEEDLRTLEQFTIDERKSPDAFIMLGIAALTKPEENFKATIGEVNQLDLYFGMISYTPDPVI
jgi:hypothetical protein